jgi:regulatory protein
MPSDCTARALKLLAGRSHFRRQLEAKLATRGFEAAEVEATLDRLTELGYLDDERVAGDLIRERRRRGPVGRRRMRAELDRRGADPAAAESALETAWADHDDLAAARVAAARWSRSSAGRRDPVRPEALARHLDRQGFEAASIVRVVREVRAGELPDEDADGSHDAQLGDL